MNYCGNQSWTALQSLSGSMFSVTLYSGRGPQLEMLSESSTEIHYKAIGVEFAFKAFLCNVSSGAGWDGVGFMG